MIVSHPPGHVDLVTDGDSLEGAGVDAHARPIEVIRQGGPVEDDQRGIVLHREPHVLFGRI